MPIAELHALLLSALGAEAVSEANSEVKQPFFVVPSSHLLAVCTFLRDDSRCYFDMLTNLTGMDYGDNTVGVVYHLHSIPYGHAIVLKCRVPVEAPNVPSVMSLWRTADWHEREAFDLLGIHFEGHPDLRRILLPDDWEGHPLRKDYKEQETYHGVKVGY